MTDSPDWEAHLLMVQRRTVAVTAMKVNRGIADYPRTVPASKSKNYYEMDEEVGSAKSRLMIMGHTNERIMDDEPPYEVRHV